MAKEKKVRAYKNRREEMKIYYQKTKEIQKARAIAWHAAKRAREKEEPREIEEEEEYKMTEKEREPTIIHETTERALMSKGMSYDKAHQKALEAEWKWRHKHD